MRPILRATVFIAVTCLFIGGGCHRHKSDRKKDTTGGVVYVVKKGDTLWSIASAHKVDIKEIIKANGLKNPNRIETGQKLFIPTRTRPSPPKRPKGPAPKKDRSNARFLWPVKGKISSGFGMRKGHMHEGIDIYAPEGTPILAAAAGRVIYSDNKIQGYGNLIIIQHAQGYKTIYAHNKVNLVDVQEQVKAGEIIARVGRTGKATGSHLHFEIRLGTKALDPLGHLPK